MTARVHFLKHFPQEHQDDLDVAFYVILYPSEQDKYVMTRDALLRAVKLSAAVVSSRIRKEVYDIRAYHVDEGTPPPRESQVDSLQPKWIIIGVSLAVIIVVVIIVVVLCW